MLVLFDISLISQAIELDTSISYPDIIPAISVALFEPITLLDKIGLSLCLTKVYQAFALKFRLPFLIDDNPPTPPTTYGAFF